MQAGTPQPTTAPPTLCAILACDSGKNGASAAATAEGVADKYQAVISALLWSVDPESTRKNIARYINHACRPNAESDVNSRKRKVIIRAIKTIEPGEEITYDYGKIYFNAYIGKENCLCPKCVERRGRDAPKRAAAAGVKPQNPIVIGGPGGLPPGLVPGTGGSQIPLG